MGRDEKGFTLVELLIVIAIIAILAAVAIPQFTKYKKTAAASAAQGALSTCMSEIASSYADNGTSVGTCNIPKGTSTEALTLNGTTGAVTLTSGSYTVSGITVTCTIISNSVACTGQ